MAALTLFVTRACTTSRDESTSGNRTAGSSAGAESAIDSVMARYIAGVEQGDTAAIAATLVEEVEIVFPTGPMRKGRADVTRAFAGSSRKRRSASSVRWTCSARSAVTWQ